MNVVEIIVTAKNMSKAGFAEAEGSARNLGGAITKVGGLAGIALAGIGIESVKMASTFEAQMTRLNTQAGVSQSEMGKLNAGVLKLAGTVGTDPDSLAESLFHVESNFESMGITSDKALSLVATAAKGAKVGGADMVDVTNALTAAVASGIPGVQNFDQAMGALNATVGVGDMSMQDLADAMGTGAVAVVKQYGLSITDVGAALAVFGDNNIRGAKAGTQLRIAVQSLAVPAKGGVDALNKLGLQSDTLAKDMQTGGLNKAITDLKTHLDAAGISASQQGLILTEAFGKKAGTGLNILVGQYDRLESKYPALTEGAQGFGKAWEGTQKTMKQQLDQIEMSFKSLMITIGEKLIPIVESMIAFFSAHTEVLKVLGIVVGVFLVGAFTAWAVSVIAATWPILLIIAAVAAVVVGVYELWKNWDTVWGAIKTAAEAFGHWMWDFFVQWVFHDGLEAGFFAVRDALIIAFNAVWMAFKAVGDAFVTAWNAVCFALSTAFNAVVSFIMMCWNQNAANMRLVWTTLTGWITGAWNSVVGFVVGAWNGAVGFFRSAISSINGFFSGLFSFITGGIKGAVDYVNRIIGEMVGAVRGAVDKAKGMINSIPVVGTVAKVLGFAHGGVVGHAAEGGPRNGVIQMNERGGELVSLPNGSKVYSNEDTERYINQNGGGGGGGRSQRIVLEIRSSGSDIDELILYILRHAVRVRGGNVQVVLGASA